MTNLKIKQHVFGKTYSGPHFFVLCKGLNSGKPFENELQNCFVIMSNNEMELLKLKQLCNCLHKVGTFKTQLIGSVIPFIRIGDFKKVLFSMVPFFENSDSTKIFLQLDSLEKHSLKLKQQLVIIPQLQQALFFKELKLKPNEILNLF